MAKYNIPHKEFMQRLVASIPGSRLDEGDGLVIPHIHVAIVVEDWGPNKYDRFSMFHYNSNGLDRYFWDGEMIPAHIENPVEFILSMCLPTLVEKHYGGYIEDIDIPEICLRRWNNVLADKDAELAFMPRK
jgi:hypothetical protein